MKLIKSILVSAMTLFFIQYCSTPKAENPKPNMGWDGVKKDTINKTDGAGFKQGEWKVTDYRTHTPILIESGLYINNKKQGIWHYYDSTGKINRTVEYKDDHPLKK